MTDDAGDDGNGAAGPFPFPSEAWIAAWARRLNDNDAYAAAAEGWGVDFDGDFRFEVRPDDRLDRGREFHVALVDGECTGVGVVDGGDGDSGDGPDYGFALRAAYTDWRRLIEGDLGAREVATGGAFDVEGSKMKVLEYTDAAAEMLDTATRVPTRFEG